MDLSTLQKDVILVALQLHAAVIQQTISDMAPQQQQPQPTEEQTESK